MPYASDRQRRFMHARHPEIAKRWDAEYGGKVGGRRRSLTALAKKKDPRRRGDG
jgi:hypothetical protein